MGNMRRFEMVEGLLTLTAFVCLASAGCDSCFDDRPVIDLQEWTAEVSFRGVTRAGSFDDVGRCGQAPDGSDLAATRGFAESRACSEVCVQLVPASSPTYTIEKMVACSEDCARERTLVSEKCQDKRGRDPHAENHRGITVPVH